MRKLLIISLFLLTAVFPLAGQADSVLLGWSVRGTVRDARTGKPVEAVHVRVPARNFATVTNADGEYTIKSDREITALVFSHLGYRTQTLQPAGGEADVRLVPEATLLDEASIISGDAREILLAAIFYRETVRKRQRYPYISEAVARLYKTGYDKGTSRDHAALDKSRVLLSPRAGDTLSVKVQGGPAQAVVFDVVKNPDVLFSGELLPLYQFTMDRPAYIGDRLQFVIRFQPGKVLPDWPLYSGTVYIDRERLSFTRIEMAMDLSDEYKATRALVVRKPFSLRFHPKEVSFVIHYSEQDGLSRLSYYRSLLRFDCDWKKRLFRTGYTALNELVVTDIRDADAVSRYLEGADPYTRNVYLAYLPGSGLNAIEKAKVYLATLAMDKRLHTWFDLSGQLFACTGTDSEAHAPSAYMYGFGANELADSLERKLSGAAGAAYVRGRAPV